MYGPDLGHARRRSAASSAQSSTGTIFCFTVSPLRWMSIAILPDQGPNDLYAGGVSPPLASELLIPAAGLYRLRPLRNNQRQKAHTRAGPSASWGSVVPDTPHADLPEYCRRYAPLGLVTLRHTRVSLLAVNGVAQRFWPWKAAPVGEEGVLQTAACRSGYGVGLVLATGIVSILSHSLSNNAFLSWGWRIPFVFSVVLVLIALWIRTSMEESQEFVQKVVVLGAKRMCSLLGGAAQTPRKLPDPHCAAHGGNVHDTPIHCTLRQDLYNARTSMCRATCS